MDFFKRINQPAKFETPVIEKRDHPHKGTPAWNRGIDHLDPETRKRVALAGAAVMRERGHTDEMRAHLSKVLSGRKVSDETKAKLSAAAKARPPRGATYAGRRIVDWAKFFGVDQSTVRQQIMLGRFAAYYEKKTGKKFVEKQSKNG